MRERLLSLVLDHKLTIIPSYFPNTVGVLFEGETDIRYPNVYELAHKCKEWAFKQDVLIGGGITKEGDYWSDVHYECKGDICTFSINSSTEYEAVFRISEWIMVTS